ncbi:MAG: chorismate synthase [Anaerolineae bacterium]|nr:chorismate synthase [Anaerolineae bacterium]
MRFLTAGESHGPALTAILEGMPAGLPLAADVIGVDLARRQGGYGRGARMQIETDTARILGGVMNGQTTGGPVSLYITNKDWESKWRDRDIAPMTVPRPGHADLTGAIKYGYGDLRLALERASARETAARVAVGAVCKQLLGAFGIQVQGYVCAIGAVDGDFDDMPYEERFAAAEQSDVRCPDPAAGERMRAAIRQAKIDKDTLGGVFEVVALGLPPGLGSHVHYDRRLGGRLVGALCSIQAVKGAEIGPAFENARQRGTQVHDPIVIGTGDTALHRASNRAGGLEGGITTGAPLVVRGAMKPISTTLTPIQSVDLAAGAPAGAEYERSDFCAVPAAVVVGEAMAAFVLADALLEKLGGDSIAEMRPRFEALRRGRLDELAMDDAPWRFGYEG